MKPQNTPGPNLLHSRPVPLRCDPQPTASTSLGTIARNANSGALPWSYWVRISRGGVTGALTISLGHSCAHWSSKALQQLRKGVQMDWEQATSFEETLDLICAVLEGRVGRFGIMRGYFERFRGGQTERITGVKTGKWLWHQGQWLKLQVWQWCEGKAISCKEMSFRKYAADKTWIYSYILFPNFKGNFFCIKS